MPEAAPPKAAHPRAGLTGKQRRHLRALAHHLDPVVQIGKEGLTAALHDAVRRGLTDHELIKVRVLPGSSLERREIAAPLAQAVGAHLVGNVGRILILYRPRRERPDIVLPAAGASPR
jgi:RNA-binding protein